MQDTGQAPAAPPHRLWLQHALVLLFLAAQIAMPLSYYLGDDIYDERFAWRMFSPIRMVECTVQVLEDSGRGPRPLKLSSDLALPWINWMERGHRRVVEAYVERRCEGVDGSPPPRAVRVSVSCPLPGGTVDPLYDVEENACKRD